MSRFVTHNFFCIQCGNPVYPILRKRGRMKGKFHRKRLYCPHCKIDINCIEVRNMEEEFEFKEKFNNGDFVEEAQESIAYIQGERI